MAKFRLAGTLDHAAVVEAEGKDLDAAVEAAEERNKYHVISEEKKASGFTWPGDAWDASGKQVASADDADEEDAEEDESGDEFVDRAQAWLERYKNAPPASRTSFTDEIAKIVSEALADDDEEE
jgi:hypothetical protein